MIFNLLVILISVLAVGEDNSQSYLFDDCATSPPTNGIYVTQEQGFFADVSEEQLAELSEVDYEIIDERSPQGLALYATIIFTNADQQIVYSFVGTDGESMFLFTWSEYGNQNSYPNCDYVQMDFEDFVEWTETLDLSPPSSGNRA